MKEEYKLLETLGQKLGSKEPYLREYAMNELADRLAILKAYIEIYETFKKKKVISIYDIAKIFSKHIGSALAIMKMDTFSQLGIRLGSNIKVIDLKDKKK